MRQPLLKLINSIYDTKIITVMGAGGCKDKEKRSKMGYCGLMYSDILILTEDTRRNESLKDITVDLATEDKTYLICEILQMVAHAACCVLYQDRKGVVHIEPWNKTYTDYRIEPHMSYSHPEYSVNKPMKAVSVGYGTEDGSVLIDVNNKGETQTISNPFICTEEDALRVGNNAKNLLENRKVISGDFRADLRMDVLDTVLVVSKYASNAIGVTNITYSTTGGSFKAKYTGRVISIALEPAKYYSGELISGEV